MIERRPHWDDDLIDSVGQSAYITEEDVYAVIAAVEDWQQERGLIRIGQLLGHQDRLVNGRIEAEAAIQRVRDVCDVTVKVDGDPSVQHGWDEAIKSVLRALDGDA